MNTRRRRFPAFLAAVLAVGAMCLSVAPHETHAASATKVTGKVSGRTNGRILAVLPSGSSSFAAINSNGTFSLTIPHTTASSARVSLHIVNSDGSYAGPISIGKKPRSTSKYPTWYGAISLPKGKTTALPTITWSETSKYGKVTLARTSSLTPVGTLKKTYPSTGKPAGAGRLGLAATRAKSAAAFSLETFGVNAFDTNTDAGDDLDGDGLPNSLDIDDDGDGFPDPVDPSSGSKGSTKTSMYDSISTLESGIIDGTNRVHSPINYNILRDTKPDLDDLIAELSLLDDANFYMWIRAVAPFFSDTGMKRLKDAWVDCAGLGWCLTTDTGTDAASFVSAPRLQPFGDGKIGDIWKYAFTNHSGSACNIHVPAGYTSDPSDTKCKPVKWGTFSQKDYLTAAKTNGSPIVTQALIDWTTDHTGGFGLYDPYVLTPGSSGGKGLNERGFDLMASVQPRGYTKFLTNLQVGDVFYINATLDDGTSAKIAMTVAPYFQTAPTVFSFQAAGDAEATVIDYTEAEVGCDNIGDLGCRYGTGRRPVAISASNPVLTLRFWRPQRQRVSETDGPTGLPFLDIGGLNYRISVRTEYGPNAAYDCPNSSTTFSDTNNSVFTTVSSGGMSNEHEYMRDPTGDSEPAKDRYITASVDFSKCTKFMGDGPSTLDVSDTSTRFTVNLEGDSEPKFGGNRSSTTQGFEIKFK